MASIADFTRSSISHVRSATLGVAIGVPSSLIGIFDRFSSWQGYFLAAFAAIALITVIWIKGQPSLSERQIGSALSWLAGSLTGFLVCLILPLIAPPAPAQPYNAANDPNPCVKVVAYGFKCSSDSLSEAMYSHNVEIVNLLVEGGIRVDAYSVIPFTEASLRIYVDALHTAGKLDELRNECKNSDEAETPYGCARSRGKTQLYCALRPYKSRDQKYEAVITEAKRRAGKYAAQEYDAAQNISCDGVVTIGSLQILGANYEAIKRAAMDERERAPLCEAIKARNARFSRDEIIAGAESRVQKEYDDAENRCDSE